MSISFTNVNFNRYVEFIALEYTQNRVINNLLFFLSLNFHPYFRHIYMNDRDNDEINEFKINFACKWNQHVRYVCICTTHVRACPAYSSADSKKLPHTSVERYFSVYTEICLQLVLGRNAVVALYELLRECWWLSAHIQHLAMLTNIYSSTYTRVPMPYIYIQKPCIFYIIVQLND